MFSIITKTITAIRKSMPISTPPKHKQAIKFGAIEIPTKNIHADWSDLT